MNVRIRNEILNQGLDDIVQFAEVISIAEFSIGVDSEEEVREIVEDSIRSLLMEGLAEIGELESDGPTMMFVPWNGDATLIVNQVMRRWKEFGRDPGLGEICWLSLTDGGREIAKSQAD